jgi:hypothetical protein
MDLLRKPVEAATRRGGYGRDRMTDHHALIITGEGSPRSAS